MEISLTNIHRSVNFLSHLPRRVSLPLHIERLGFIHQKSEPIERYFTEPCVMLVFNGNGILEQDGARIELKSPFVLWNWTGEYKSYWPEPHWDELYITFNQGADQAIRNTFDPEFYRLNYRPMPPQAEAIRHIPELLKIMRQPSLAGAADRIDLLVYQILLDAIYPALPESLDPLEQKIMQITEYLQNHFTEDIDLAGLAETHGMSYSTFKRHWRERFPYSPLQYLMILRNAESIAYLQDSTLSIGDIARKLGFRDQFYFATFFRKMNNMTPSEFRKSRMNKP